MRNFNNNRTILLKGYLPEVLKNVRELDAIMDAENPEIEDLWQACEDCMNDQFISEATENGIERREKMLGITPFATDTLDDRRFRLLSRYMEDIPYTRKSLINMLTSLCGEGVRYRSMSRSPSRSRPTACASCWSAFCPIT